MNLHKKAYKKAQSEKRLQKAKEAYNVKRGYTFVDLKSSFANMELLDIHTKILPYKNDLSYVNYKHHDFFDFFHVAKIAVFFELKGEANHTLDHLKHTIFDFQYRAITKNNSNSFEELVLGNLYNCTLVQYKVIYPKKGTILYAGRLDAKSAEIIKKTSTGIFKPERIAYVTDSYNETNRKHTLIKHAADKLLVVLKNNPSRFDIVNEFIEKECLEYGGHFPLAGRCRCCEIRKKEWEKNTNF